MTTSGSSRSLRHAIIVSLIFSHVYKGCLVAQSGPCRPLLSSSSHIFFFIFVEKSQNKDAVGRTLLDDYRRPVDEKFVSAGIRPSQDVVEGNRLLGRL